MEILLWPQGAPLAKGNDVEDRPGLSPFLVEHARAAVIVCPGGGYARRADHEGEPIARWLNQLGISAFVLRYRVAPYDYPAALRDAQRAIRYVRHEAKTLGLDPQKIGILGFSAGGHLTASAGTLFDLGQAEANDPIERESSRPDLMVLCYPVITMIEEFAHEGSRLNLLGENPDESLTELMSCERQVTAQTPPAFLWHTAEDPVSVDNSLMFAAALSRSKVPFDLHVFEKGKHGLGLAEEDEHVGMWKEICAVWLKRNGFFPETGSD